MASSESELLQHTGPFTQEVVIARGRELRALPGLSENARHRLFATFVELGQNIARYSAVQSGPPGEERGAGVMTVSRTPEGRIAVKAENPVTPDAAAALAAQVEGLASLDADALKRLHRDRRRGLPPPGSIGAGLGLIELARHACSPITQKTRPSVSTSPDLLSFSITVTLDPN